MADFDSLRISDFDHLEFAVADLDKSAKLYHQFGFERVATRELRERDLRSYLMAQNGLFVVLSQSARESDHVHQFVKNHGDGVINVAFRCEDAVSALETSVNRGATLLESPRSVTRDFGQVHQSTIAAFGDVRHSFISRNGSLFLEGFETSVRIPHGYGAGLTKIDHVTCNVESGQMDRWAKFYENIFGLRNTRFFDIRTERTGLYSKVMQSPRGEIKMPFNEPTEAASQIQEFININHGPGVQHVALLTDDICKTLRQLRSESIHFLTVPSTYYEDIPRRVPNVSENLKELEELGILVDGDEKGYLLQIFTHNVVGPFFYEVIQRKGNDGFGEGNFRALFEAIERDQIRRGVLKP